MHYEIAQIATPQPQCRRAHYVGKLAIVAVNQTSTVLETAYPRHLPRWPSTQHTLRLPVQHYALPHELRCRTTSRYLFVLLLRLFVAIVGYINNLQLRSLLNLNPFTATPPRNYNPQKLAANHQAAAIRPASQTPTYSYDDNHLNYDAPCNLRQQPYKRKRQSRPFCLNEMSLYRAYFAPGMVDPWGLHFEDEEFKHEERIRIESRVSIQYEAKYEHDLRKPSYSQNMDGPCIASFAYNEFVRNQTRTDSVHIYEYSDPRAIQELKDKLKDKELGRLAANVTAWGSGLAAASYGFAGAFAPPPWKFRYLRRAAVFGAGSVTAAIIAFQIDEEINQIENELDDGGNLRKLTREIIESSVDSQWSQWQPTKRKKILSRVVADAYCICPAFAEATLGVPQPYVNWKRKPTGFRPQPSKTRVLYEKPKNE